MEGAAMEAGAHLAGSFGLGWVQSLPSHDAQQHEPKASKGRSWGHLPQMWPPKLNKTASVFWDESQIPRHASRAVGDAMEL